MMNLCIVIEVIQKRIPAITIVIMPGTHPKTLITVRGLKLTLLMFRLTRATTSGP